MNCTPFVRPVSYTHLDVYKRQARDAAPRVWQPKAPAKSDNLSFEDMMSRFKSQSEEKMADLDHETNNRRGGGYAPRSRRGR